MKTILYHIIFIPLKCVRPIIQGNIFASKNLFWLKSWFWYSMDLIAILCFFDAAITYVTVETWFLWLSIFSLFNDISITVGPFLPNSWLRSGCQVFSLSFFLYKAWWNIFNPDNNLYRSFQNDEPFNLKVHVAHEIHYQVLPIYDI